MLLTQSLIEAHFIQFTAHSKCWYMYYFQEIIIFVNAGKIFLSAKLVFYLILLSEVEFECDVEVECEKRAKGRVQSGNNVDDDDK